MTDGAASSSKAVRLLKDHTFKDYKSKLQSFKLFCIGYGSEINSHSLLEICKAGNNGKNHISIGEGKDAIVVQMILHASNVAELTNVYAKITKNLEEENKAMEM